jgi:hypothetical protein
VHQLLAQLVIRATKAAHAGWTAHMLLGAVRADLLRHLAEVEGMTARQIRSRLAVLVRTTVAGPS